MESDINLGKDCQEEPVMGDDMLTPRQQHSTSHSKYVFSIAVYKPFSPILMNIFYNADTFVLENPEEMHRLMNMLGVVEARLASKVNMGRWQWSEQNPRPKWETMSKAAIWAAEEWKEVKNSMTRPLTVSYVQPDSKAHSNTIYMRQPKEGEEPTGPHMVVSQVGSGKGIAPKLHAIKPLFVCSSSVSGGIFLVSEMVFSPEERAAARSIFSFSAGFRGGW